MSRHLLKCLLVALASFVLLIVPCQHAPARTSTYKQIKQKKKELKTVEKGIKEKKKLINEVKKKERSLLEELENLDKDIEKQWHKLEEARRKWTEVELEFLKAREVFQKQKALLDDLQKKVESRLRGLYETGTIGTLNIIFAAETVPEIYSRQAYLKKLLAHDKEVRKRYLKELERVKAVKDDLQFKSNLFKKAALKMEQETLQLEAKKEEKKKLLQRLIQQGEDYSQNLAELQQARQSLKALLKELRKQAWLERKRREKQRLKAALSSGASLVKQKGDLEPPVYGAITRKTPAGKKVRGVLIAAPWGSNVTAFFDGQVVYAGSLKGYGNVIILDHGDGFMSLVAQLSVLFRQVGDMVHEGDVIGLSGSGPWIPEGVYFELRWEDKTLNPLPWFNPSWLKVNRAFKK